MQDTDAEAPRFLAEWFAPHLSGPIADVARRVRESLAALPIGPRPPRLLCAIEVPQDRYAFGLFIADSVEDVTRVCQQAGLPADQISAVTESLPYDQFGHFEQEAKRGLSNDT